MLSKPWVLLDYAHNILARFETDTEAYEATYTGEYPDDVEVAFLSEDEDA